MKRKAKKTRREDAAWTAFVEHFSVTIGETTYLLGDVGVDRYFENNVYAVSMRAIACPAPFGPGVHLSIRRRDRAAVRDWRDLQRVKNLLLGPEAEAFEVYPANSRLVDAANQFHLWSFPGLDLRGVGFTTRDVNPNEREPGLPSKQRPFDADTLRALGGKS